MATNRSYRGNVLVTGASSGIGEATARLFAANGYRVFGTSRRTAPETSAGSGRHAIEMLTLDVRSAESVARCVAQVADRAGSVDVLVNNAGVMHQGFAEETGVDEAEAVFATNLFGVVRVTNAVLPGMRERGRGRIINVGSLAAWVGEPGEAFYAASKAALARYTEALRHEVSPLGLSVSLVEPGAFATNVLEAASRPGSGIADYDGAREAAHRTLRESMGRGGDPRVVASLIVRIARLPKPRYRYGAGDDGRWLPLFKMLVPQALFDRLLRRAFARRGGSR